MKKILLVSDSARIMTGFGTVVRNIGKYLYNTQKYEIRQLGWFDQPTGEDIPWPIYHTQGDATHGYNEEDKYGVFTLPQIVKDYKPNLLWCVSDYWMQSHIMKLRSKDLKIISYLPVDGICYPQQSSVILENSDITILYTEFGKRVMKRVCPNVETKVINHGVDTETFHPLNDEDKGRLKTRFFGIPPESFLLGVINRPQPRKGLDYTFKALYYLVTGEYIICNKCNRLTCHDYDELERRIVYRHYQCPLCYSKNVRKGRHKSDIYLNFHGPLVDPQGHNLIELQNDYHLKGKIFFRTDLQVGVGISSKMLNLIYNSFDVGFTPFLGEGWGLFVSECMAAGVPVVVTNYSAPPEFCKGAGDLIKVASLRAEPITNIRRAVIDMNDCVTKLLKLYYDKELRKVYGKIGREKALKLDWTIIGKQWENLIDEFLYPDGCVVEDPLKKIYKLEIA